MLESAGQKRRKLRRESSATSQGEQAGDASLMLSASSRVTVPDDIVSGHLLPELASGNLQCFQDLLPAQSPLACGVGGSSTVGPLELSWGICCSGSEGVHYVVEAMTMALSQFKVDLRLTHKFSCESDKKKRAWIKTVLENGPLFMKHKAEAAGSNGCIFQNILDMGQKVARCERHEKNCEVGHVDVLVLGTSCKDLSRANSSVDRQKLVLAETQSKGGSAQTFRGFLAYCEGHRPTLIIYENVDSIDDKVSNTTETNLSILRKSMQDLGYQGQKVMTDAQEFGLPCRRRRLYVFFVLVSDPRLNQRSRDTVQVFETFRKLVSSCLRSAPCATKCLLNSDLDSHAEILKFALAEVVKIQEKTAERKAPPNNTWMNKHMEYAEQLGVRWATPLPVELVMNEWFSTLTKREGDCLRLSRVAGPTAEFRNLSQSVGRAHGNTLQDSGKHVAPTMLPGQVLWTESQDRLLSGVEAMIQGYPIMPLLDRLKANGQVRLKENFTESFLTDLAGNAMALPVVLAIFQAGMAAVGFKACEQAASEDDVRLAMEAVAMLGSSTGN